MLTQDLWRIAFRLYPSWQQELDQETTRLYGDLLADIPEEALRAGLEDHAKESAFRPLVADWRRRALAHVQPEAPAETPILDYQRRTRDSLRAKYEAQEAERRKKYGLDPQG